MSVDRQLDDHSWRKAVRRALGRARASWAARERNLSSFPDSVPIRGSVSSQDRAVDRARTGMADEGRRGAKTPAHARRGEATWDSPPPLVHVPAAPAPPQTAPPSGESSDSELSAGARVAILSGVLALISLALLLWGPITPPRAGTSRLHALLPHPWIVAALLVVLSAAAVSAPVSFHHRGHTYLFSLS